MSTDILPVLFDGWSLAREANNPSALHLLTLLDSLPAEVQALVALPAAPQWNLPPGTEEYISPLSDTEFARLQWEQRTLPWLAHQLGAKILHLTGGNPPLFGRVPSLLSPTLGLPLSSKASGRAGGLSARLRLSMAQGGLTRLAAVLWPADLPDPGLSVPVLHLPPVIHPAFRPGYAASSPATVPGLDLPETYLLYAGPDSPADLYRLLQAWTWAVGSIGEYYPLLVLGLSREGRKNLAAMLAEYRLGETVRPLPEVSIETMVGLYAGCSALFHPAEVSPWDGPVRMAMAAGKPIVASESRLSDALAGPSAYLTPPDHRALGAALITVIVEENLSAGLAEAAQQRADTWARPERFGQQLLEIYRSFIP